MYQEHFVIVGAGIAGLSTAYALLAQGKQRVTVLEQATVDHERSTSHGPSRLLRFEYGPDAFYSEMVMLSLSRWMDLQRITKRTLYMRTGLLVLGTEQDGFTLPSYRALRQLGLPIERLSEQYCRRRFPQFETHAFDMLTYNIEAGILHASASLRALKDLVCELGGRIHESTRVTQVSGGKQQQPVRLTLTTGETLEADRVVLATGPWVHRLLGELHLPVRMTRQYLLYFSDLPISSFGVNTFPAFMADDLYGLPIHSTYNGHGTRWLKVADHARGPYIDPDDQGIAPSSDRIVARAVIALEELIPALRHAHLVHIDKCMYDMSPDGDFIIDSLPDDPRIIFITGLSGHGFKFGPLLGELLSALVCGEEPVVDLSRFRLARFQHLPQWQQSPVA